MFALTKNKAWRALGAAALGVLVWTFSSKAVQDILVFGTALFALRHYQRGSPAWRQPAGLAFILVVLYTAATLPFSTAPLLSLRDFSGLLEIFAGAFAIPVVFYTRQRREAALLYSAIAISLTLLFDLIRLALRLGSDLLGKAHSYQPFILNHSNVACMMAGLSFLVYAYFFIKNSRKPLAACGCAVGMAVALVYQTVLASRGPQIALLLTLPAAGLCLPRWHQKLLWFGTAALIMLAAFLIFGKINPRLQMPIRTAQTMTSSGMRAYLSANLSQRDIVWRRTLELIRQRPCWGYGYGKRNFERIYYHENTPPPADFYFPHPHNFWLKLLFEFGMTGTAVHLTAWLVLAGQLTRRIGRETELGERIWPGCIALMLLYIHIYGLGDYPDNIVQVAQFWLVPMALAIIAETDEKSPA